MKKLCRILICVLMLNLAAPLAFAQDNVQVVAAAKADLQRAGVSLQGACGAIKITNLVVWRLRPQYGLLYKPAGYRAALQADGSCLDQDQTRDGGYANDYIIDRTTGAGFDLLGDGGGANNPQFNGPEDAPEIIARNRQYFREPFDPSPYLMAAAPPVVTPPPPVVVPPPVVAPPVVPGFNYSVILQQLLDSQQLLLQTQRDLLTVSKDTNAQVTELNRSFGQTIGAASKFVSKYIAPAIAAYFVGKKL